MEASAQTLSPQAMVTWRRFLRAHCAVMGQLDTQLRGEHGLTISDYDVMLQLRNAPDGRLKMSDLASHTLLTRSGITRLIDGLVKDGWVERVSCSNDARVSYAQLTADGREKMCVARDSHLETVFQTFAGNFNDDEVAQLGELLSRLPGARDLDDEGNLAPGVTTGC